jgi:WD40 repeat protein
MSEKNFAQMFRAYRQDVKISQREAGRKIGYSGGTISKFENGKKSKLKINDDHLRILTALFELNEQEKNEFIEAYRMQGRRAKSSAAPVFDSRIYEQNEIPNNSANEGVINSTVRLLQTTIEQQFRRYGSHTLIAISADGEFLAVGDKLSVNLWDVRKGQLLKTLEGHEAHVCQLIFSADGQTLVSVDEDKKVCVWDVARGERRLVSPQQYAGK